MNYPQIIETKRFLLRPWEEKRCHAVVSVCLRSCDWATLRLESAYIA